MRLKDLFTPESVNLDLTSESKDETLSQLVRLLGLDRDSETALLRTLRRRERLGSTGIGAGIAIPHCRSVVVSRLHLAYGRSPAGVEFEAIDGRLVHHFFLIVAPPIEVSNEYLPALGRIAQFAQGEDVVRLLGELEEPGDFLRLLEERAP